MSFKDFNLDNLENSKEILEKLLESQKIIDILDDIDYDTQEMQTILSRNLPSETYEILKKYLDDNSYLKTIWSYYDDEWDKKRRRKNIFMESN